MIFDLKKSPANNLTPLSVNVNNANIKSNRTISTEIVLRLKKVYSLKEMVLKLKFS